MNIDLAAERWSSLLASLHGATETGGVWKNCDASLSGEGDLDYVAARSEWGAVREVFERWRSEFAIPEAFGCTHRPGAMYLVALSLDDDGDFWQLDVRDRGTVRGATLFTASGLQPLMTYDPRGFRMLRPGSEAAFKLVLKCVNGNGRLDPELVRVEGVRELIASDEAGYRATMPLFGRSAPVMERIGADLVNGVESGDLGPVFEHFRRRSLRELGTSSKAAYSRLSSRLCPFLARTSGKRGGVRPQDLLRSHRAVWPAS